MIAVLPLAVVLRFAWREQHSKAAQAGLNASGVGRAARTCGGSRNPAEAWSREVTESARSRDGRVEGNGVEWRVAVAHHSPKLDRGRHFDGFPFYFADQGWTMSNVIVYPPHSLRC